MLLSHKLQDVLKEAIESLYGVADALVEVVVQENSKFGDYSSSIAFGLAKKLGKKPQEIGTQIIEALKSRTYADGDADLRRTHPRLSGDPSREGNFSLQDLHEIVDRVELAGAGFLNFYLHPSYIRSSLRNIYEKGFTYENVGKGKKLQLEFVSANPTGPLTLANGRAGFFGDVLGRVLVKSGYAIEREYYVNDAGNQIEMLGKSVSAASGTYQPKEDEELYRGDYVTDLASKYQSEIERYGERFEALGQCFVEKELLSLIQKSLESMRVGFDRFTSEQKDIRDEGYVQRFLALADKKGFVYEQDGATWLKTTHFGDDKDRVLVTSDGQYTYLAVDAGHYLETVVRGFGSKINILGADHHGYISRIQAVAQIVGLSASEIILMQLVKLVRGGQEIRMSKRKGTYVTIDEVIEEIGTDGARYFFLTRAPDSQLTIDLDLAKKESKDNPVFYIQYAGARISSILKKIVDQQAEEVFEFPDEELVFAKKILFWNEAVYHAAGDRLVHPLASFAYELADSFHAFYETYRVIEGEKVHPSRLMLVLLFRKAFLEVFDVLGVRFLEKM